MNLLYLCYLIGIFEIYFYLGIYIRSRRLQYSHMSSQKTVDSNVIKINSTYVAQESFV